MPEIFDVATHFDDISLADAYSNAFAFKGQFSTFDESSPDGSVSKKRTLSVKPGTVIPARRAVSFFDETWLIGQGNTDGLYDQAIRKAYWMKRSAGLLELVTPAQLLSAAAGTTLHAAVEHQKDTTNVKSDNTYDPFWHVFFAIGEPAAIGKFVKNGSFVYRIRGCHADEGGFLLAQCDQLDQGLLSAVVQGSSSYNPVTDSITATNTSVQTLLLEPSKVYKYATEASSKVVAGDMTAILLAAPAIGTTMTVLGAKWKVVAAQAELDAWAVHIRRV